jgi:hypothetical protein
LSAESGNSPRPGKRKCLSFDYSQARFEEGFGRAFKILRSVPIQDSSRTLYLMQAKTA